MKMIGVISDCGRCQMMAAVSGPSMIGMQTSSKMTAKSWAMRQRGAARPESASTIEESNDARAAFSASCLAELSSTIKMDTSEEGIVS
jgi:hypothetical protein